MENSTDNSVQEPNQLAPNQTVRKGRKGLIFLLVLLTLVIAGGGVYIWQQQKVNDLSNKQASLNALVSTLQAQQAQLNASKAKTPAGANGSATNPTNNGSQTDYSVVTGIVEKSAVGSATVDGLYIPEKVTEIWLEYGTAPDALSKATPHVTQNLGEGTPGAYVNQAFSLSSLDTGKNYFYRIAGKANNKTIYGGVATFTSLK